MNLNVRPQVAAFALLMEQVLQENDWKGGWQFMTRGQIMGRLRQELEELQAEIMYKRRTSEQLVKEAVDVANFCMFMADIEGALSGKATSQTNFEMVKEFHETFNPHQFLAYPVNAALPYNVEFLRERLIQEEFEETIIAIESRDVTEIAKELADLLYVVYGTAYTYGIDIDAVFAEVHKSNMSKVGDDGKPIQRTDGKILKGPNYQEPDIAAVLRKQGAQI